MKPGQGPVEQRIGLLHHVIAVTDAIAYAHGRNIIHRDLKPSNIIHRDLKPSNIIVGEFGVLGLCLPRR